MKHLKKFKLFESIDTKVLLQDIIDKLEEFFTISNIKFGSLNDYVYFELEGKEYSLSFTDDDRTIYIFVNDDSLGSFDSHDINKIVDVISDNVNIEDDFDEDEDDFDEDEDDFDEDEDIDNINLPLELEYILRHLPENSDFTVDDFFNKFNIKGNDFAFGAMLNQKKEYEKLSDDELEKVYQSYKKS
jgi:hypothetical protein